MVDDGNSPGAQEAIRFGHYQIHELLGVGGMAEIYRGSVEGAEAFRKPVVIKRVKPEFASNHHHVQMFIDEARINARLDHANIVSVFDFGEAEEHYYLAMEFIDGLNLQLLHVRHKVQTQLPLPWEATLLIVRDVLRALDYAHRCCDDAGQPLNIVHRDVNLVNVMVRRDGTVKLLDFGCAKASQSIRTSQTRAGIIKGKVAYMSPEQTEDKPLDGRTDVFAASIVLHELLTGRRLFFGEDELEMLRAVRGKDIPDPRMYRRELPEALARVTMKGLERDLARRYASAGAMADELEDIVHEHRVKTTVLRDLMSRMMAEDPPPHLRPVSQKHGKVTASMWRQQKVDDAPQAPWSVSGVIAVEAAPNADSGAPTLEMAPVLTSAPHWLRSDVRAVEPKPSSPDAAANPWQPLADTDDTGEGWMDAGGDEPAASEPPRRASTPWTLWLVLVVLLLAVLVVLLIKLR